MSKAEQYHRWEKIKHMYRLILKHGWYISNYHDKWDPLMKCFLLRSEDCLKKEVVRL